MRRVSVIALILLLPLISGCYDYLALDSLGHPYVIGIDTAKSGTGADFEMTGLMVTPSESESTEQKSETYSISLDGLSHRTRWELSETPWTYGTTQLIIFSRSAARGGIMRFLDEFLRDASVRNTILLAIADRNAGELITSSNDKDKTVNGTLITDLLSNSVPHAVATKYTVYNFASHYFNAGYTPVLPVLSIGASGRAEVSGCALFRGDRLVRVLDVEDYSTLNLLRVPSNRGFSEFELDGARGGVEFSSSRELHADIREGRLFFRVKLYLDCNIISIEDSAAVSGHGDKQKIKDIERSINETVYNRVSDFLDRMINEWKIDALDWISAALPSARAELEPIADREELISSAGYELSVGSVIDRVGEFR